MTRRRVPGRTVAHRCRREVADLRERIPASSGRVAVDGRQRCRARPADRCPARPADTGGRRSRQIGEALPRPLESSSVSIYIYKPSPTPPSAPSSTLQTVPDRVLRNLPIGVSLSADRPRGATPVSIRDSGGRVQKSETGSQQSGYTDCRWMWKNMCKRWKNLRIPGEGCGNIPFPGNEPAPTPLRPGPGSLGVEWHRICSKDVQRWTRHAGGASLR